MGEHDEGIQRPPGVVSAEHLPTVGAADGRPAALHRHFGLWTATALNVTMVVGAGVFITIPFMLKELPGPYALLGWLAAGVLILFDSLIWSELGAAMPGSGGSYVYLLEGYGRERWGRLMSFLFIWQFLLSGPLEIASGLIAIDMFSQSLSPVLAKFNAEWTWQVVLWKDQDLSLTFSPVRAGCLLLGVSILVLLYRNVRDLGRLTLLFWAGVLAVVAWIAVEGALRFDPSRMFDFSAAAATPPNFLRSVGPAMALAIYAYLGYYNVCYVGDEVREPGKTIPRAVLLSAVLIVLMFVGLHLAMLGTVSWRDVPGDDDALKTFSLPAEFMRRAHGEWAARLVTVLLVWSCFGAAFAGLLGYARIPYGAALAGHFYRPVAAVHPRHRIPHVSLLLVGGFTLFWTFFDLQNVITALIVTRILEQFVAQIVGLIILRRTRPDMPRPFRVWLYPLPCGLALAGWLYVYISAGWLFVALGMVTLIAGVAAFLLWSRRNRAWPFREADEPGTEADR
jgi:amino acid transporter